MAVYLIHSDIELGTGVKGRAQHYLGYAEDYRLWQRLSEHALVGSSNPSIIRAFLSRGATLRLVRVWPDGGHALERYLKSMGQQRRLCPVCSHHHPEETFPTLANIRLINRTSGTLPSPARLLKVTGSWPSGTPASKHGRYHLRVTPLLSTSSDVIVVSPDAKRIVGSTSSAAARQRSEAS
jgi:hypothetical protein